MSASNSDVLSAPYVLEYAYKRSVGPVIGRFLTGLRDGEIVGIRTRDGRVIVPPTEYDPKTGDALDEFVKVADKGKVITWSWIAEPRKNQPLTRPFGWALILLDGADTAMLHAVDAVESRHMRTGMRVRVRWAETRVGQIQDIACFVPAESAEGGAA